MQYALQGRRILIVEDDYFLAMQIKRELRKVNALVLGPVPSVDLALDLISSTENLDASVLDINLQGEMSYPVADALLERDIPFVLASGYGEGDLDSRYAHVVRCDKPFEFRTLQRALLTVLQPVSPSPG